MKKASITLGASGAIALAWLLFTTPAYAAGEPIPAPKPDNYVDPRLIAPEPDISPTVVPPPTSPVTTSPTIIPPALRDTPNNPLSAPQDIDGLLRLRVSEDLWQAMYSPLPCLDTTADCIQRLQIEAVQNSPVIKELDAKIATVNQKIEEAKTNNKKSIELAVFEPALQVFLRQDTVLENGQTRKIGVIERIGQLFSNPGPVLSELLGAIGIPLLRGAYGGTDAQQSRAIQISDLVVKVAEIDRGKTEVTAKTRERVQQMVLEFDVFAREFQAEQAIAVSEEKSLKLYAVSYAAGDGDTDVYLNRKERLEKTKLQVFKAWARVRAQITTLKAVVVPRD
jgi:hypothetical protein